MMSLKVGNPCKRQDSHLTKLRKKKDGSTGRREPPVLLHQCAVSPSESPSLGSIRPSRSFRPPVSSLSRIVREATACQIYCPG